jgi:hypothetical protein
MKRSVIKAIAAISALVAVGGIAVAAQDKYTLKVPGGLAFAEFRGFEAWQTISISHNGDKLAVILGNPAMIKAFQSGAPGNGKGFPNGARMAKIHWTIKTSDESLGAAVPDKLHDVDFMVKDTHRFADSGGWGWAVFEFDPAKNEFRPGNTSDMPPQANDAKCGFSCHTGVAKKDYVFTAYGNR